MAMNGDEKDGRERDGLPDGWRIVWTQEGNIITETTYDAEGNVVAVREWRHGQAAPRRRGPARGGGQRPI